MVMGRRCFRFSSPADYADYAVVSSPRGVRGEAHGRKRILVHYEFENQRDDNKVIVFWSFWHFFDNCQYMLAKKAGDWYTA